MIRQCLLGIILLLVILAPPASAVIELHQGDIAYMNETVDISQAISWPNFQIAWCKANNYDCDPPDQVIDITGDMDSYWLDPSVFHYGTYYRWDGKWHRAEYSIAFRINAGTRPLIINQTNLTVPNATPQVFIEGPYQYLIARGDSPLIYSHINRTDPCHLWIFGNSMAGYDIPVHSDNFTYSYRMQPTMTFSLPVGDYKGYLQFDGPNEYQDIFLDGEYLDTPYDDSKVPDVPIETWNLIAVKGQFDRLSMETPRFDDTLIPIKIYVTDPEITITEVQQDEDKLWISGVTTWDNETTITLRLDPDNYKLPQDIRWHTWETFTSGDIDSKRTFATALKINKDELKIGPHDILLNVTKAQFDSGMSYLFRITDTYVMPTPTPSIKRSMVTGGYSPIPVIATTHTPLPTTPSAILTYPLPPSANHSYESVTIATPSAPLPTAATADEQLPEETYDPNIQVPIPWWLALVALVIVWRKR